MGGLFGLGILLELQDRASQNLNRIASNLDRVESEANQTVRAMERLNNTPTRLDTESFTSIVQSMRGADRYYQSYYRRRQRESNKLQQMAMQQIGGVEGLSQSMQHSIKEWGKIGGVTTQGKNASKVMGEFSMQTQQARRALVGFNAEGTKPINTEQKKQALQNYATYVNSTQRRLKQMFDNGEIDGLGYTNAIKQMQQQYRQFNRIQERGFRNANQYMSQLRMAGISTNALDDQRAIALERQRGLIRGQADMLLSMKPSSMKVAQVMEKTNNSMRGASRYTLEMATGFQRLAQNTQVPVIMNKMVEAGYSMKDANDYVMSMTSLADGLVTIFPAIGGGALAFYGTMGAIASQVVPSVGKAFDRLKTHALSVFDPLLQKVANVEKAMIGFVDRLLTKFEQFRKVHPIIADMVENFMLLLPAMAVIGAIIPMIQQWGFVMQSIIMNITQAGGSAIGLAEAIAIVVGNALALATTVVIFKALYDHCEAFRKAVDRTKKAISDWANEFKKAHPTITMFLKNIGKFSLGIFSLMTTLSAWKALIGTTFGVLASKIPIFAKIGSALGVVKGGFLKLLHPITALKGGFETVAIYGMYAVDKLKSVGLGIASAFLHPINTLKSLGSLVLAPVGMIGNALRSLVHGLVFAITNPFGAMKSVVIGGSKAIATSIKWIGMACLSPIKAVKSLGTALKLALTKIPKVGWLLIISVIATALYSLYKTNEKFRNGVNKAWNSIKKVVTGVCDSVSKAMKGKLAPVIKSVGKIFQTLGKIFSTVGKALDKGLGGVFSKMGMKFKDTGGIIKSVSSVIVNALNFVLNGVQSVCDQIQPILDNVLSYVKGHTKEIEGAGKFIGNIVNNTINTIKGVAKGVGQIFSGDIKGGIDTLSETLGNAFNNSSDLFTKILQGISDNAPQIISGVSQLFQSILNTLIEHIPEILNAGVEIVKALLDGIVQNLPMVLEAGVQVILAIINAIVQNLPMLIQAGVSIITSLVEAVAQNLPLLIQAGVEIITGLVTAIADNLPMLINAGFDIIETIGTAIVTNLPALISAGWQIVTTLVSALIQALPQLLGIGVQLVGMLIQGLLSMIGGLISAGISLIGGLASGILNAGGRVLSAGVSIIGRVLSAILGKVGSFLTAGGQLMGGVAGGLLQKAGQVVSNARSCVTQGVTAIRSGISQFISAGGQLIAGLASGIKAKASAVVSAAKGVVQGAINGAKALLGIHSPSRVFKVIGKQTFQGFEGGVDEEGENTVNKVGKVTRSIIDAGQEEASVVKAKTPGAYGNTTTNTNNNTQNDNGKVIDSHDTYTINITTDKGENIEDSTFIKKLMKEIKRQKELDDLLEYN